MILSFKILVINLKKFMMKKYILKLSMLSLAFTMLMSCENAEPVLFDIDNGQSVAAFNSTTRTVPVPDTGDFTTIQVGVTTKSSQDRAISLSIDPSSTADPSEYTVDPSTLVIPAGEFVANIVVNGNFEAIPETGLTSVTFNLASVDGAKLQGQLSNTVNLFRFCPFSDGANFLGDYQMETLSVGIFGATTLTDGVVTISEGSTVADRQFSVAAYPAFDVVVETLLDLQ